MSILIKGMEMPKTGEYRCVIRKWGEEITIDLYGNEELCGTLIPVPDHGRLIDAEKIYDAVERRYRMSSGIEHKCERDLLDLICAAPTIIPSEDGE